MRLQMRTLVGALVLSLAVVPVGMVAADADTVPATPIPEAELVPITDESEPFAASSLALERHGYVEEEYFISGQANVYDWADDGSVETVVRTPSGPYINRILVRRPTNPRRFSGNVIVELMNPTLWHDYPVLWQASHEHFLGAGDAWIGITAKPVAVEALKRFDSDRYEPLSWANPLPPEETCENVPADSSPATENGLVWDIVSQVGALLKSTAGWNPLADYEVEKLYATGMSQTGSMIKTYNNGFHERARMEDGSHIYDGYLLATSNGNTPLHQCTRSMPTGSPHSMVQPRGVPFIHVNSQSERQSVLLRQPDSDDPASPYRLYEVAGSAHLGDYLNPDRPRDDQVIAAGLFPMDFDGCDEAAFAVITDFPLDIIFNGAFTNLDQWVRDDVTPPRADRISVVNGETPDATFQTDEFGNAVGGVRTPYVDVPIATYFAHSSGATPAGPSPALPLACRLYGHKIAFDQEQLAELYRNAGQYRSEFIQATNLLVKEGWITLADAKRLRTEAAHTHFGS